MTINITFIINNNNEDFVYHYNITTCSIDEFINHYNCIEHIKDKFPNIDINSITFGVFGCIKSQDYLLQDGDRIEFYTPLLNDPKEIRRKRAALKNK
ncbi:MAG: RnfH family protein [Psittacicella sp.]